jgi:predicted acyl esterase
MKCIPNVCRCWIRDENQLTLLAQLIRRVALTSLLLFGLGGLFWISHRQALDYVHPARLEPPKGELLRQNGIPYQEVDLLASDGVRLAAWYTPPQNGALILVAHGYGDRRSEDFYSLFASHGYGVLAWDFRGHGASGGELVTLGYNEVLDVEAALAYALPSQKWNTSAAGAARWAR